MYLFSVCTNITEVKSPIAEAISKGAKMGRVISQAIQTIFVLFFFLKRIPKPRQLLVAIFLSLW